MPLEPYYPLREGRLWVYRCAEAERPSVLSAERRVLRVSRAGEGWTALIEEAVLGEGEPFRRRFRAERGPLDVIEDEVRVLRGPLEPGRSWEDGPDLFRIVSLEETAAVPAGTFKACLRVDYGNDDLGGGTVLYAPAVGMVYKRQWGERGPRLHELLRAEG